MSRPLTRGVWLVAGLHGLLLLMLASRYGYHRDELYFLEAGRHLAFGYVDQPPLVPALARFQDELFGASAAALRVVPALVSACSVVMAGVLARELGGGRRSQVLSAGAVAGAGFVLSVGHLLSTPTIDFAVWLTLLVVLVRLIRTDDPRWWLAYGVVAGVGLWNKHLVVLLSVAVLIGLLIDKRWSLLVSPWLVAGGAVALLLATPVLVWQAVNGWPQVEMAGALADRLGTENRMMLLPMQFLMLSPLLVPFGWEGVRHVWSDEGGRWLRPLLWTYVATFGLVLAVGGRPYYPLPVAAAVVVTGVVATERSWSWSAPALIAAAAAFSLPVSLPVLPAAAIAGSPITAVNDTLAEQVGWPELAATVAEVVDTLPPEDTVILLAGTYGEAGALDRYGPGLGLPTVYSGHNSYWHWRRPDDDEATVVTVRMETELLDQHFGDCQQATRVENNVGIGNEAQGAAIQVCRDLRSTWERQWPAFRTYK